MIRPLMLWIRKIHLSYKKYIAISLFDLPEEKRYVVGVHFAPAGLDPGPRVNFEDRSLDKLPSSRSPFTGLTNNVQCSMFPSRAIEPGSSSSSSSRFSPTAHWHSPPTYA